MNKIDLALYEASDRQYQKRQRDGYDEHLFWMFLKVKGRAPTSVEELTRWAGSAF